MYTIDFGVLLGAGKAGLVSQLRARLYQSDGTLVGSEISVGFVEIGNGNYHFHCVEVPNGLRGGVKFYLSSDPTVLTIASINPENVEYIDTISGQGVTISYTVDVTPALIEKIITVVQAELKNVAINVRPDRLLLGGCVSTKPSLQSNRAVTGTGS